MKRLHRTALGALTAAALTAALVSTATTSARAAGPTKVEPAKLSRGADPALPHLRGKTVVDGDTTVSVKGANPILLGPSGASGYVLQVGGPQQWKTVRIAPDRKQRTLVNGTFPGLVTLAGDGETMAVSSGEGRRVSVDVRSARNGRLLGSSDFRGAPRVLDIDGDHVVVASFAKGAVDYNWRDGDVRRITKRAAYTADLSSNRLAVFTKDPYEGGCTVVTPLSRPGKKLWRSCREAVTSFSPNGARMVTTDLLADGPGPGRLWERSVRGNLFARYDAGYVFGTIKWETQRVLLLEVIGQKKTATVRCSEGDCERASALRPTTGF